MNTLINETRAISMLMYVPPVELLFLTSGEVSTCRQIQNRCPQRVATTTEFGARK